MTPETKLDPDEFCRDRLDNERCDTAVKWYAKILKAVYTRYASLYPQQGKAKFDLGELLALVSEAKLLGHDLTSRETKLAFRYSRMVVVGVRLTVSELESFEIPLRFETRWGPDQRWLSR